MNDGAGSGGTLKPQRGFARLFNPRAIAVVGASPDIKRIGGQPIPILLDCGYRGGIYPVNPKYPKIGDLACYASVADVPKPCDLALVAVAGRLVPEVIRQCGKAGIAFATVFSAGFREVGPEGVALEAELKAGRRRERRAHDRSQLHRHDEPRRPRVLRLRRRLQESAP